MFQVFSMFYWFSVHQVKKDVEGYDFYKHFGGRIKLMENAQPFKQLGDIDNNHFAKVEVIFSKEEPYDEEEVI